LKNLGYIKLVLIDVDTAGKTSNSVAKGIKVSLGKLDLTK
jgi:hypothetical protein